VLKLPPKPHSDMKIGKKKRSPTLTPTDESPTVKPKRRTNEAVDT
jgi:hypothetical protein